MSVSASDRIRLFQLPQEIGDILQKNALLKCWFPTISKKYASGFANMLQKHVRLMAVSTLLGA